MNEPIKIFLSYEPKPPTVTHQERKFGGLSKAGRPIFYSPPALRRARAEMKAKLSPYAPREPLSGPLQLTTIWLFPHRLRTREYRTQRPDTDNLQKMLKDLLTECRYWTDDAQVAREIVEKQNLPIDQPHGILVSIKPLEQNLSL